MILPLLGIVSRNLVNWVSWRQQLDIHDDDAHKETHGNETQTASYNHHGVESANEKEQEKVTMKRLMTLVLATACLGIGLECNAQNKDAAKIDVEIVSDGKLKEFKMADHKDKIVVVEFWATWCPPCRTTIPHLSKLQKKYGDKVVILGVSSEKKDKVKKFYEKMKKTMTYTVAIDKNRTTNAGYMGAYRVRGIPHAFIIKRGKVVWHGHPGGMDAELAKAVSNKKEFMDLKL